MCYCNNQRESHIYREDMDKQNELRESPNMQTKALRRRGGRGGEEKEEGRGGGGEKKNNPHFSVLN